MQLYAAVLRTAEVPRLLAAGFVGRLRDAAIGLGITLLVYASTGSFGTAGIVAAAFSGGFVLGAPLHAHLSDRLGQARVLVAAGLLHTGTLIVLAFTSVAGADVWMQLVCSAAAGATTPALNACLRGIWPALLPAQSQRQAACALDSTTFGFANIVAPSAVAAVSAFVSPAAALLTLATVGLIGTLWFASSPAIRRHHSRSAPLRFLPLHSPAVGVLTCLTVGLAMVFGALQMVVPAAAQASDALAASGLLLTAFATGALFGGLWYGSQRWKRPPTHRLAIVLGLSAVVMAFLPLARPLPVLAGILALAGAAVSPAFPTIHLLMGESSPGASQTEALTWIGIAIAVGNALGRALAGSLLEAHGIVHALALPAAIVAATGTAALFLRSTSSPARTRLEPV